MKEETKDWLKIWETKEEKKPIIKMKNNDWHKKKEKPSWFCLLLLKLKKYQIGIGDVK